MARMLHRREKPAQGQKVFIAVAAYDGCGAGFSWSLFHTGAALAEAGLGYELAIYSGNCHVDDSRNRLVRDFLQSDCTDLVFLDADVGWQSGDFLKLLAYDRDVVAGVYPKKHGDDAYPVMLMPGEIWSDADGLIEVMGVPTGFLRIRRHVLETLAAQSVLYNAKSDRAFETACIFERQIHDGTRWGGDYVFCRKWRAQGGKIYVDPLMRFEHSGEASWQGQLGAWLRMRAGIGLKPGFEAIREGRETADDLIDLFDVWQNPFAAPAPLLKALIILARQAKGPILELGSGLSSLVMAVANPDIEVWAMENSTPMAEHLRIEAKRAGVDNLKIVCRPLIDGWYDESGFPEEQPAIIIIDGPPCKDGKRMGAFNRLDLSNSIVVADDIQTADTGVKGMREALERTHDVVITELGARSFAVGVPKQWKAREAA